MILIAWFLSWVVETSFRPDLAEVMPWFPRRSSVQQWCGDTTRVSIDRRTWERIVAHPEWWAESGRVVPFVGHGWPQGFALYAVRSRGVLGRLGLRSGDLVRRVNGLTLSTPDTALRLYASLSRTRSYAIELERAGRPMTIVVQIDG
jgi:hypothetical protein